MREVWKFDWAWVHDDFSEELCFGLWVLDLQSIRNLHGMATFESLHRCPGPLPG